MMNLEKIHRLLLVLLILSIFTGCFSKSYDTKGNTDIKKLSTNDQQLFEKIKEKMDDWTGEYDKIVEVQPMIESFIVSNPDFLPIYIEKARLEIMIGYTGNNDYIAANKEALKIIKELNQKNPDYPKPYVLSGHVYKNLSDFEKALESLTKAEQLGTDDPWLYLNWADILYAQENYSEALTRAEMGLRAAADNAKALVAAFSLIRSHFKTYLTQS